MAISIRGSTVGSATTSNVATKPTGVVSGDLLLLLAYSDSATTAPGAPSGFTSLDSHNDGTGANTQYCATFYKVAGASEPASYTFTSGSGTSFDNWAMVALTGQDSSTPVDAHNVAGSGAGTAGSVSNAALTASVTNDELVLFFVAFNSSSVSSWPTGVSTLAGATNASSNGISTGTKGSLASGSTGALATTPSATDTLTQFAILVKAPSSGTAWSKSFTDAISETDTSVHNTSKPLTDAFSELDVLLKSLQKPFNDFWSTTDNLGKQPSKPFGETISSKDTQTKGTGKNLSDAVSELDNFARTWAARLTFTDWVSRTDALSNQLRRTFGDAFSETDTATQTKGYQRSFTDAHSALDSLVRVVQKVLADAIAEPDSFSRTWVAHLSLLDSFSELDALSKMPKKTFLDWFVETDFVTATKSAGVAWTRNLSDAHSALDVLLKAPTKWVFDNFSEIDLFARTWTAHLTLQDWVSETEAQLKQVNKGVILDATSSTDAILKGPGKSLPDSHSATDSQSKGAGKGLVDGTSALDSSAKSLLRTFVEQLSETDQVFVTRGVLLKLLDSVSLTDFVSQNYQKAVVQGVLSILSSFLSSSLGCSVSFGSSQLSSTPGTQSGILSQTPGHL